MEWASRFMQLHLDLWPGWEGESTCSRSSGRRTSPHRPDGPRSTRTARRTSRTGGRGVRSHRRHARLGRCRIRSAVPPIGTAARRAVEAVWRIESGRLIAGLARVTGDVGLAEELAQDALVTALEQWPRTGIPPNPAGWLMTTAKNRAIDTHRRRAVHDRKLQAIGRALPAGHDPIATEIDDALDDHIGDDLLRLIFTAAHPVLSTESRVALTLRCLGGLSTEEIARAFLVPTTDGGRADRPGQTHPRRALHRLRTAHPRAAGRAARRRCWRSSS